MVVKLNIIIATVEINLSVIFNYWGIVIKREQRDKK